MQQETHTKNKNKGSTLKIGTKHCGKDLTPPKPLAVMFGCLLKFTLTYRPTVVMHNLQRNQTPFSFRKRDRSYSYKPGTINLLHSNGESPHLLRSMSRSLCIYLSSYPVRVKSPIQAGPSSRSKKPRSKRVLPATLCEGS